MTKLEQVRSLARECVLEMSKVANQVNWEDRATYGQFLAQTYFYVRHATRVLAAAAARCTLEEESLHLKLIEGITEEKGHEILAIRDLRSIGYNISQFEELPETSCYYQTLFHKIGTEGPYALIGYFIPLEGLAAIGFEGPANRMYKAFGKKGASFAEMHCKVDEGHFDEGLEFLAKVPSECLPIIERNLVYSTKLYIQILEQVKAAQSLKKAA